MFKITLFEAWLANNKLGTVGDIKMYSRSPLLIQNRVQYIECFKFPILAEMRRRSWCLKPLRIKESYYKNQLYFRLLTNIFYMYKINWYIVCTKEKQTTILRELSEWERKQKQRWSRTYVNAVLDPTMYSTL